MGHVSTTTPRTLAAVEDSVSALNILCERNNDSCKPANQPRLGFCSRCSHSFIAE